MEETKLSLDECIELIGNAGGNPTPISLARTIRSLENPDDIERFFNVYMIAKKTLLWKNYITPLELEQEASEGVYTSIKYAMQSEGLEGEPEEDNWKLALPELKRYF